MEDWIPWGSVGYWWLLVVLGFARGADLLSTWIATPTLALEGNPIVKALGWKWAGLLNLVICGIVSAWPMVAIILATTSLLVAARNFSVGWQMRTQGEAGYRNWFLGQMNQTPMGLYLFCLAGQTVLVSLVGVALVLGSSELVPVAIGFGIVAYAAAVAFFTLLAAWRGRTAMRI